MDIKKLRQLLDLGTPEEITAGCNSVNPSVESYKAAEVFLWRIVRQLIESNQWKAAAFLLYGTGNPNPTDAPLLALPFVPLNHAYRRTQPPWLWADFYAK
jgi:hypothetical protein